MGCMVFEDEWLEVIKSKFFINTLDIMTDCVSPFILSYNFACGISLLLSFDRHEGL